MAVCEFCGHDDERCQQVPEPTLNTFKGVVSFHRDWSDQAEGRDMYATLRKSFKVYPEQTAQVVMNAINDGQYIAITMLNAMGWFDKDDRPMDTEWRRNMTRAGLASGDLEIRDEAMQLVEHWPDELMDILRGHEDSVQYMREYKDAILTSGR